jgi:endoribonuclease LACTB2
MLRITQYGPITVFRMGRHIAANRRWVLYETHAFLLDDTMIDTGTIAVQSEWKSWLNGHGCSAIINTHHHEDHTGNNRLFQEKFEAPVYAHPAALSYMENPESIGMQLYRRVIWGIPAVSNGRSIGDEISTSRHTLRVIHTPGHTHDHICLYEPINGWLFSGDIFCGKRLVYHRADEDFWLTLESLKRLATLDVRTMFCGLKGVVENGGAALKCKIQYMEELKDKVLNLHQKGLPPDKIRRRLMGYEDKMFYLTNGHFSKQNVVNSIIGVEGSRS